MNVAEDHANIVKGISLLRDSMSYRMIFGSSVTANPMVGLEGEGNVNNKYTNAPT